MNVPPNKEIKNSWQNYPWDMFVLLGFPFIPVVLLTSSLSSWLLSLSRIEVYAALILAFTFALIGAGLLFWAKLPLYRAGVYLSFGPSAIPDDRKSLYYWGIGLAAGGCILALLLIPLRT